MGLAVGIDAVDVARFRTALARWPRLGERLFTDGERRWAAGHGDGAMRLAARFAAKEAVMKALGVGLGAFAFRDVEVVSAPTGRPQVVLRGAAAALAAEAGLGTWCLSLTHTDDLAQAVVVAQ